jgi:CubicO group peptidase (beta-lactamase class C family)
LIDGRCILSESVVAKFTQRAHLAPNSTWALGWDTVSAGGSSTGRYFSERSFGSLGFSGTSIWADPDRDLGVVLLTNRVHPTRDNWQIKALRPEFHNAVSEALV